MTTGSPGTAGPVDGTAIVDPSLTAPDGPPAPTANVTDLDAAPYVLLDAPRWELDDAIDPRPDDPVMSFEQPPMLWFAEYRRLTPGEAPDDGGFTGTVLIGESVRVSMHDIGIAAFTGVYEGYGFTFGPASGDDRSVQVATGSPTEPAILIRPMGATTLLLLSYQLTTDQLVELSKDLYPATTQDWLAAGGEIR